MVIRTEIKITDGKLNNTVLFVPFAIRKHRPEYIFLSLFVCWCCLNSLHIISYRLSIMLCGFSFDSCHWGKHICEMVSSGNAYINRWNFSLCSLIYFFPNSHSQKSLIAFVSSLHLFWFCHMKFKRYKGDFVYLLFRLGCVFHFVHKLTE